MLTQGDFINIEKQASALYESLELEIIEEIAIRIANFGYANTVVINDIKIAQEMGILYQDIVELVAEYNNTSYEEVNRIFTEASETGAGIDAREAARRSPEDVAVSNCLLNMAMPICCNAPESAIILLDIGVRFMTIPPS